MAAFVKYDAFVLELGLGGHNLSTGALKVALTNTAPTAAHTTWSAGTYPPPTAANGYTAGGNTLTGVTWTQAAGVAKLVAADTVFTATAGGIGPFQYAVIYNSTASNKLIGSYNYGSAVTLASTETLTVDFDAALGVLTLT